jgi:phosphohistidine phosphatase SixA
MKLSKLLSGLVMLQAAILLGCVAPISSDPGTTTTVILIRHAERTTVTKLLTERGRENAKTLVQEIGDMKIRHIYSPKFARNMDTVRPLADHLKIKIIIWPDEGSALDAEAFAAELLKKHAGETILWVGNTNNLPGLYYALGGNGPPPDNYGDLFILKVSDKGETKVDKRSWGKN